MSDLKKNPLIILDFGSQYTQLIARRIRELGVYCEVYAFYHDIEQIKSLKPSGFILSGGPSTVTVLDNPRAPDWVFESNLPVLGICYGMQTMAVQCGGEVASSDIREFGYAEVKKISSSPLWADLPDTLDVWMSHGDKVTVLPPNFHRLCETSHAPIAGMAHDTKPWFGLQFHPEVTHTPEGINLLRHFIFDICHASSDWTSAYIIDELVSDIKRQVGDESVLLGLSGGVDSSVVAALLHRAIGAQLICVFVDTGLLRQNEVHDVQSMFQDNLGIRLITVNASERFLSALKGVSDPEEKRKIIGKAFVDVFQEEAKQLPEVKWLAQGTIYPDVIESAAVGPDGVSAVIKSHHNVGGLPETLHLKLLEPIRILFKDEVRQLGVELGLPHAMVYRHPFPGPGLGVRVMGEVKPAYVDVLRQADAIFIEELRRADLYHQVSQAFAVYLPVKSVGVMGDGRRYDDVICLRAVETIDFMTAHWSHLPWDFLSKVSERIINEVKGVSRVTYDISGKPPATIEWE